MTVGSAGIARTGRPVCPLKSHDFQQALGIAAQRIKIVFINISRFADS